MGQGWTRGRELLPGAQTVADQVLATVPRSAGRDAVLTDEDGNSLAVVKVAPSNARLLSWRGQVFEHHGGVQWRRVDVVPVQARAV